MALGSNGSTWNIGEYIGSYRVQTNTTYYVKIVWNKASYIVSYSTDKETYIADITVGSTLSLYPTQIIIGDGITADYHFMGIINLNYCTLSIANIEVWQGMDDVGLATRMATDMSNIDDNGIEKLNELVQLKTVNGQTIKGTGDITISGGDDLFIAVYNETEWSELYAAYKAGKHITLKYVISDDYDVETYYTDTYYFYDNDGLESFGFFYEIGHATINENDGWVFTARYFMKNDMSNITTAGLTKIDNRVWAQTIEMVGETEDGTTVTYTMVGKLAT